MPTLTITETGANGQAHDYNDVATIATQIKTWANTTKLDYVNLQDDGIRITKIASHARYESGRVKVRNNSGAQIDANKLIYFSGTYNDGTNNYPTIALAVSTQSNSTTKYARAIVEANIGNNADGYVVIEREVSGLDTSGLTVGDPIWLSDTAGGYETVLTGLADIDFRTQIVGQVSVVDASVGRIIFGNWSIIPYSIANEVAD